MIRKQIILFSVIIFISQISLYAQTWVTSAFGLDLERTVITIQQYEAFLNDYENIYPYAVIQFDYSIPFGFGQNFTNTIRPTRGSIPRFSGYFFVIAISSAQSTALQRMLDETGVSPTLTYGNEITGYMSIEFYPYIQTNTIWCRKSRLQRICYVV